MAVGDNQKRVQAIIKLSRNAVGHPWGPGLHTPGVPEHGTMGRRLTWGAVECYGQDWNTASATYGQQKWQLDYDGLA